MASCIVIGGGPSGMMAALQAKTSGNKVILLEKNEKLGKKLYITGKGRCNLTNAADLDGLLSCVNTNARFLYSAFSAFGSAELMAFFEGLGVPLTTERGRRVFPASGRAVDITIAMEKILREKNVKIKYNQQVTGMEARAARFTITTRQAAYEAEAVIIATGGLSYPSTGSTGDGYAWAKRMGHAVAPTYPSLVPITAHEPWVAGLNGLSLKNIRCQVLLPGKKKPLYSEIGEMLFMPDGVTGPLILSASRFVTAALPQKPMLLLDLKPGLSEAQLDERLVRDFSAASNKDFGNSLHGLLPERLIETIVGLSGIAPHTKVHTVTRTQRQGLVGLLKGLRLTPVATHGFDEAVITLGGVDVREVNPSTLMSKKVKGLFFAGEVLDVDAMTGGYNLQIAFSTGYLAGKSAGAYTHASKQ